MILDGKNLSDSNISADLCIAALGAQLATPAAFGVRASGGSTPAPGTCA